MGQSNRAINALPIHSSYNSFALTHWGQVTHICVIKPNIIGSDNGLSPGLRQAIIWTNAEILLTGPLGTNFREIVIEIYTFSFKKMHLKMLSEKWRPFCLSLNVLTILGVTTEYLRDWSRSGGSYGNNTRVICCPAPGCPESAARGTSPPDNKSRGCCCRNSRPTVINPDYNMTKTTLYNTYLRQNTFKITTKPSDVAYLPPLWRHASLLNEGSCSFTHPVAKGQCARGTSSGT